MIARLWHGYSTPEKAPGYRRILLNEVLPEISKTDGYDGSFLLERTNGGEVEFIVITLWESMNAIRKFAGADYENAVIDEEAAKFLTHYDTKSLHYQFYEKK